MGDTVMLSTAEGGADNSLYLVPPQVRCVACGSVGDGMRECPNLCGWKPGLLDIPVTPEEDAAWEVMEREQREREKLLDDLARASWLVSQGPDAEVDA